MAPYPPNNTKRYWLDYNDGQHDHSMLIRVKDSVNDTNFNTVMDEWLTAWADVSYELTITGARFAANGSNIALPVTWTGSASYGTGTMPANRAPLQTCFIGRDDTGVRFRMFIFGINVTVPDNFRYVRAVDTALDAVYTIMETNSDLFETIAGGEPIFNPYADANYNSYWERAVRT